MLYIVLEYGSAGIGKLSGGLIETHRPKRAAENRFPEPSRDRSLSFLSRFARLSSSSPGQHAFLAMSSIEVLIERHHNVLAETGHVT